MWVEHTVELGAGREFRGLRRGLPCVTAGEGAAGLWRQSPCRSNLHLCPQRTDLYLLCLTFHAAYGKSCLCSLCAPHSGSPFFTQKRHRDGFHSYFIHAIMSVRVTRCAFPARSLWKLRCLHVKLHQPFSPVAHSLLTLYCTLTLPVDRFSNGFAPPIAHPPTPSLPPPHSLATHPSQKTAPQTSQTGAPVSPSTPIGSCHGWSTCERAGGRGLAGLYAQ